VFLDDSAGSFVMPDGTVAAEVLGDRFYLLKDADDAERYAM